MRIGRRRILCLQIRQILPSVIINRSKNAYPLPEVLEMELYVKGRKIPMNEFVNKVLHDVVMAIITNLRDIELDTIERIEIA